LLRAGSITFADGICSADWFTSTGWPREGDRVYAPHKVTNPTKPSFELVGAASAPFVHNMAAFAEAAAGHVWTGPGPGRVVIAADPAAAYKHFMPADKYAGWERRNLDRNAATGGVPGGMGFLAADGVGTAVIQDGGSEMLTYLFGHEFLEVAIDARPGFRDPRSEAAHHSRALWKEYVVERCRREIAGSLGWSPAQPFESSDLNRRGEELVGTFVDLWRRDRASSRARELAPDFLQALSWQWTYFVIELSQALGRADGGLAAERREVEAFLSRATLGREVGPQWHRYRAAVRDVFAHPDRQVERHDDHVLACWGALWDALAAWWNRNIVG
jgi:hypothetical protein